MCFPSIEPCSIYTTIFVNLKHISDFEHLRDDRGIDYQSVNTKRFGKDHADYKSNEPSHRIQIFFAESVRRILKSTSKSAAGLKYIFTRYTIRWRNQSANSSLCLCCFVSSATHGIPIGLFPDTNGRA